MTFQPLLSFNCFTNWLYTATPTCALKSLASSHVASFVEYPCHFTRYFIDVFTLFFFKNRPMM